MGDAWSVGVVGPKRALKTYSRLPARSIVVGTSRLPGSVIARRNVAVHEVIAAQVDQLRDTRLRVDRVQLLREALHGDQRLAVRRRDDPVQVELAGDVHVVAAQRNGRDRARPAVPGERHLVQHRALRVGEVDALLRRDGIVDERPDRRIHELERVELIPGASVVDTRVPEARARDPELAAVVLDPGRRGDVRLTLDEQPALPGAEAAGPDGTGAHGADIGGLVFDLDPFRGESVRKGDLLRIHTLSERRRRPEGEQGCQQQDGASHTHSPFWLVTSSSAYPRGRISGCVSAPNGTHLTSRTAQY